MSGSEIDHIYFDGSCELSVNGLSLSPRGFSVEFTILAAAQDSWVKILEEVMDNKFYIEIKGTENNVGVYLDGKSK